MKVESNARIPLAIVAGGATAGLTYLLAKRILQSPALRLGASGLAGVGVGALTATWRCETSEANAKVKPPLCPTEEIKPHPSLEGENREAAMEAIAFAKTQWIKLMEFEEEHNAKGWVVDHLTSNDPGQLEMVIGLFSKYENTIELEVNGKEVSIQPLPKLPVPNENLSEDERKVVQALINTVAPKAIWDQLGQLGTWVLGSDDFKWATEAVANLAEAPDEMREITLKINDARLQVEASLPEQVLKASEMWCEESIRNIDHPEKATINTNLIKKLKREGGVRVELPNDQVLYTNWEFLTDLIEPLVDKPWEKLHPDDGRFPDLRSIDLTNPKSVTLTYDKGESLSFNTTGPVTIVETVPAIQLTL